jgi:hypothetical protein
MVLSQLWVMNKTDILQGKSRQVEGALWIAKSAWWKKA